MSGSVIDQTKKWILDVVVGLNFCPFALREVKRDAIRFDVVPGTRAAVLGALETALLKMEADPAVETLFLIVPEGFARFTEYLKLLKAADALLRKTGREGRYQIASFHPGYLFADGTGPDDAANYTNRSPYPMLQILREESVERAVDSYPDTMKIPEKNAALAREKGLEYMRRLRAACMTPPPALP